MTRSVRPRFYFSLRSPYSWLAHERLVNDYPDVAESVEWMPFWEPDDRSEKALTARGERFHYVPMSRAKHLYILQDVGRLARSVGLTVTWPVDRDQVWEVAHLAYLQARREGLGREFVAEAYRARFEQGRDICDPTTVAVIGRVIGADADRLASAHEDDDLREEGVSVLTELCRRNVFGAPFFSLGLRSFWGVDRLAPFVALLRARATGTADGPGYAADVDALAMAGGATPRAGAPALDHEGGCG